MLMVSCARADDVLAAVTGHEVEGITFTLKKREGLLLYFTHNAPDDTAAAAVLKRTVKAVPKLKNLFLNVRSVDESGRLF